MKMQVGKWGNSLAVRLPKALTDRFGIAEGDEIDTGGIEAVLHAEADEARQANRLAAIERLKQSNIKFPPDWKFDREEANAR